MFNLVKDIHSITDFKRNSAPIFNRVIEEKAPAVLTLNGSPSVVVVDVETYQNLLEKSEYAQTLKAVENGLQEVNQGMGVSVDSVFDKMERMLENKGC